MQPIAVGCLMDVHADAVEEICSPYARSQGFHLLRGIIVARLPVAEDVDGAVFGFQRVWNNEFAKFHARAWNQLVG